MKISVKTIVWVANRDTPLTDLSGILKVTNPGILVLNHNMSTIGSSNTSTTAQNPVARLLDSGNLVVIDRSDDDSQNFLWQSFDYPGDTFLPGMKLGRNTITGFNWHLRSWKSPQDPSQGNRTSQLGPKGYAELFVREGSVIKYRSGPWNGVGFSGNPQFNPNPIFRYGFVSEPDEMYYSYKLHNNSIFSRVVLTSDGLVQRYTWIDRTKGWVLYQSAKIDDCVNYALCGVHGACNIEKSPVCSCLKGFTPKFPKEWDLVDWSHGCVRKTSLNCTGDVFQKYTGVKLPSTKQSWHNKSMNLKECEMVCMKNCSCTAFTNLDIQDGGTGCLLWYGDLIDIYIAENGQDIYIRMAAAEQDHEDDTKINDKYSESNAKKMRIILSTTVLSTGLLNLGLALLFYVWKKKHKKGGKLVVLLCPSTFQTT
ncbi:unnamed protein product [Malus baccata var. baccata]